MAKKKNLENLKIRTKKIKITKKFSFFNEIVGMSKNANRLHNFANYLVRQYFFNEGNRVKYLDYKILNKVFVQWNKEKDLRADVYYQLPARTSSSLLKKINENWNSFSELNKKYLKGEYDKKPSPPRKKKTGGMCSFVITKQQVSQKIKDKVVIMPRELGWVLNIENSDSLQQIEFIPKNNYFMAHITYQEERIVENRQTGNYMSIDLGLNNLATITFSNTKENFIIGGKDLKSKNIYFNYKIAQLQSKAKRFNNLYITKQIQSLFNKRDNIMNDYLHKASKKIIDLCLKYNVDTIIIGHNKGQKQKCRMKNFVQVPIFRLIDLLDYKAKEYGIKVVDYRESFTSGTSVLDNESPNKTDYDKSRRVKRGLFVSNRGIKINADVNASYQIMKKYWQEVEDNKREIKFVGLNPVKLYL